jgi:hypothetical protein
MKYFEQIYQECTEINKRLENYFPSSDIYFFSAAIEEIIYVIDKNVLIFGYYKERFETENLMYLKGLRVKFFGTQNRYPVSQLLSFFDNNCLFYENNTYFDYKSMDVLLEEYIKLLNYIYPERCNDWEIKYKNYRDKMNPWQ